MSSSSIPRGARSEGLAYGGKPSLNWDGIWDAESRILDDGWSAELRIPFKTISFKPGLTAWGLNVERIIARKQETIRLSGTNRDSNFNNPMEAAALAGIEGVKQGLGITFRPYGLASAARATSTPASTTRSNGRRVRPLQELHAQPRRRRQLQHGFRRDRGRRAPDQPDPLPPFFPGKADVLPGGLGDFNFSSSISFMPFFSRRIGLFEGEQIPVLFGTKLYGKIGSTNSRRLDVQTGDFPGPRRARTSSPPG